MFSNEKLKEIEELEKDTISLKECAKKLEVKVQDFKKYLLDNNYIYLSEKVNKIICYDDYSTRNGSGLFYLKTDISKINGKKMYQTKITSKGYEFFKNDLLERGLINGSI